MSHNPEKIIQLMNSQERMLQVVRQMKEIPELPSEAPKDVTPLEKVEFADKGGVLTFMGGMLYPYKGFPFFEFVDKIDVIKKIFRSVLSGLYHQLKRRKLLLVTLLPAVWMVKPIARTFLYVVYRQIDRFKLKREMYCDAMRETYRAFTGTTEFHQMFRDTLCMILEMDNAYRYRFQDVIVNINKENLKQHPRKEFVRLFAILSERERGQDIKDTWFLMKLAFSIYLISDGEFRRYLVDSLSRLNPEVVALSIEDKFFAAGRKDYLFGFMLSPDKRDRELLDYWKEKKYFDEEKKRIQDESTKEHEALFKRMEDEQRAIAQEVSPDEQVKIQSEINKKVAGILKVRDEKIQILVAESLAEEQAVLGEYLTEEQHKLSNHHRQEVKALDEKWNGILTKAEDNYKLLCQQQNFT